MAPGQLIHFWLTLRYREQAHSYKGLRCVIFRVNGSPCGGRLEHLGYRLKARARNGAVRLFLLAATFCGVPATTILPP